MEYRRAYYEEKPDTWLVARHEREISPLLHRRAVFAEVYEFLLYDFFTDEGWVNEDVFAYSNRLGDQRALVIYHNRYASTRGWVRMSCGYAERLPDGGKRTRQRSLGEAFGLSGDGSMFAAYRDIFTGLEYLHRARDLNERGLRVELDAYNCRVFVDWRDISDRDGRPWGALCDSLAGRGVSSLDDALRALELKPVHDAVHALLQFSLVSDLAQRAAAETGEPETSPDFIDLACERARVLLGEARRFASSGSGAAIGLGPSYEFRGELNSSLDSFRNQLQAALRLPAVESAFAQPWPEEARSVLPSRSVPPEMAIPIMGTVVAWCVLNALGGFASPGDPEPAATRLFDGLHLREAFAEDLEKLGLSGEECWRAAARLRASFAHAAWRPGAKLPRGRAVPIFSWLHDPDVAWAIGVHEWDGSRYFIKEPFERLLWWMALPAILAILSAPVLDRKELRALEDQIEARVRAAADTGYRVEALLS
jgi:hypothetical protein